jgi:iron complex transport system substrate-binding protein
MRKYVLVSLVAVVALAALVLRIRSRRMEAADPAGAPRAAVPASGPAFALEMPRDYVVDPLPANEEAAAGPRRIVSLAPSVTEIVCALGLRDRLVGRTRYCSWPPGLASVQTVGVLAESNYGLIRALNPDLVLATRNSGETLASLTRLGIRCEVVPHEGLDEVYRAIERVGQLCDRPRTAAALVAAIRSDMAQLEAQAARSARPPRRVLVLFGSLPVPPKAVFVAGPSLFLDSLVEKAGHHNAARDVLKSSQGEIPVEVLKMLDPDIILEFRDPAQPADPEAAYRAWRAVGEMSAIRDRRVRGVGGLEWLSAGPRIAIELHRFISVLSEPG